MHCGLSLSQDVCSIFTGNSYWIKVAAEKAQKAAAAKKSAEPAPARKDSTSKARLDSTSGNRGNNNRDNKGGQRNRDGKIKEIIKTSLFVEASAMGGCVRSCKRPPSRSPVVLC